jgi:hypothetical protein
MDARCTWELQKRNELGLSSNALKLVIWTVALRCDGKRLRAQASVFSSVKWL